MDVLAKDIYDDDLRPDNIVMNELEVMQLWGCITSPTDGLATLLARFSSRGFRIGPTSCPIMENIATTSTLFVGKLPKRPLLLEPQLAWLQGRAPKREKFPFVDYPQLQATDPLFSEIV